MPPERHDDQYRPFNRPPNVKMTSVCAGHLPGGAPAGIEPGPHPYHGTTRNRCPHRRFPRSRPTV